jgi:hypothetical protein
MAMMYLFQNNGILRWHNFYALKSGDFELIRAGLRDDIVDEKRDTIGMFSVHSC